MRCLGWTNAVLSGTGEGGKHPVFGIFAVIAGMLTVFITKYLALGGILIPLFFTVCACTLGDAELNQTMATGLYTTHFKMKKLPNCRYVLDLGDVRESARVVVNGKEAGTLFCVPFRLDISSQLQNGKNQIDIYVTNLPANRIAQMDREGKEWRVFKEINVVDLNYKKNKYDTWEVMPSGLNTNPKIMVYQK